MLEDCSDNVGGKRRERRCRHEWVGWGECHGHYFGVGVGPEVMEVEDKLNGLLRNAGFVDRVYGCCCSCAVELRVAVLNLLDCRIDID